MHILSVRDVVKKYSNHTAVDHINLDIPKGIIFGLLGRNGAGKTSLIRMITSITQPDQGQIFIDGEQLHGLHPNQIGYMPEERGLYKKMKVGEQLIYLARLKGLDPKQAKKALNHWLEKFEITSWWDKKIEELSKGMQQKVQFIATVVHDPKLIILDDFGLQSFDNHAREALMDIIDDRYGNSSTIVCSQLPVSAWYDVIGEGTIADAILDRLINSSHRIDLKGESLRKGILND